jgi:hypothetical protein
MADHTLGSFMGPRWARSSWGDGAGLTAALSYSTPSSPYSTARTCAGLMHVQADMEESQATQNSYVGQVQLG